jgi:predicted permease
MNSSLFILNTVSPIFLIIIIGWLLRKRGIIQESFIKQSTQFVFNVTLPVLIFLKLASIEFTTIFDSIMIVLIYGSMVIIFLVSWLIAKLFIKKGEGRGVFIQGSFWPNNVILGLALIMNIFGDKAVSKMVMILVFSIPLNYFLSVIALTISDKNEKRSEAVKEMIVSLRSNPIILSAFIAICFSLIKIPIPIILKNTGNYIAAITLPLALIGLGGTLRIKHFKNTSFVTIGALIIKLIISPMLAVMFGYLLRYRDTDLGLIFIIFACPTAIMSFILADSMTKHGEIAGNIVIITTLLSAITIPIGLMMLYYINLL